MFEPLKSECRMMGTQVRQEQTGPEGIAEAAFTPDVRLGSVQAVRGGRWLCGSKYTAETRLQISEACRVWRPRPDADKLPSGPGVNAALEWEKEPCLEVEAGHDGQLLHGQLLSGLLVAVTAAALDLGAAAEVFWSGEPEEENSQPVSLSRSRHTQGGTLTLFLLRWFIYYYW